MVWVKSEMKPLARKGKSGTRVLCEFFAATVNLFDYFD
jgi:hypothetical protein